MKRFLGYIIDKGIKAIPRKKKVSPDIKSVKPTKLSVSESIKKGKSDAYTKNIRDLNKAQEKVKEGKKMMKEGQKSRKQLAGTGRAFQFKGSPSYHAIEPGDKDKFKANMKKPKPTKKFKTGKELEQQEYFKYKKRDKKMGGGMMGRRMGYSQGSNGKGKVPNKFKGFSKLPEKVQQKIDAKLAKKV